MKRGRSGSDGIEGAIAMIILAILAFMISSFSLSINANDCMFILAVIVSMKYSDAQDNRQYKRKTV